MRNKLIVALILLCSQSQIVDAGVYKAPPQTLKQIIIKAAKRHGIEPSLYLAIVKVESNFQVDAYNLKTADYGLSQVNRKTAKRYRLDLVRLLKDPAYNANAGALILADFKRMYKHKEPKTWMCRYNVGSGAMSGTKAEKCIVYLNKVFKHYNNKQPLMAKGE